ncbi:hypothetical protein AB0K52_15135 [Glycomyces sp. NPDC049804]|uniref:hypothetical protein n=1 Tax=Glycomyces sp. NPDC049804 TaxID=3154363 RepID=UPI0034344750
MPGHLWCPLGPTTARCALCRLLAAHRPHPISPRSWFTRWIWPDGTWSDNRFGLAAPVCTGTPAPVWA